jgi:tRNA dimethylallyltransferase
MDIGTAKPTEVERQGVPHHLIDIATPDQTVSLAAALEFVRGAVADVVGRRKTAILCGGTGQYVRALREGWVVPAVAPNADLRRQLEETALAQGAGALHRRLLDVDPMAADRIGPENARRLIRALEVYDATGEPISVWQTRRTDPVGGPVIRLARSRAELFALIEARADAMLDRGLEEEVRALVAAGYGFGLPAMSGVGYGEWRPYLEGAADVLAVRTQIVRNTKRLVRKQEAWFREGEPEVTSVHVTDVQAAVHLAGA